MARRGKKNGNEGTKRKILGILLILFSILILVSLFTHSAWDDQRFESEDNPFTVDYRNQVGTVGAFTSYFLFWFFGWLSVFLPFMLILVALKYLDFAWRSHIIPMVLFAAFVGLLVTMIFNVYKIEASGRTLAYAEGYGGYLFFNLTLLTAKVVGKTGSVILMGALIAASLVALGYRYPWLRVKFGLPIKFDLGRIFKGIGKALAAIPSSIISLFEGRGEKSKGEKRKTPQAEEDFDEILQESMQRSEDGLSLYEDGDSDAVEGVEKKREWKKSEKKGEGKAITTVALGRETKDYVFPGLDLLSDNPEDGPSVSPDELAFTAKALKDTLETFGVTIDGQIEKYPGPVITRYQFKPAAGVKVHQITNLSDDLALALQAKRIRIIAPIPGKAAVGIEIPNRKARMVFLKDIINSEVYADTRNHLPLALGKSISGKPYVTDLAKMPHLLIAGATGSGKSVCINALITSLIFRLHPRELKFIFIDPKMLELSVYAGIPHLGRPVVTNPKRAEKVLSDAVGEMESRYKKLAGEAVRNIHDYNAKQKNVEDKMPYIVIIVDELADMMMAAASSRIEMLITRLAQMARAVGIHLILATQRPSVDVITGLIKANFSARIGFQVASKVDSRTILDANGAEKLLGNGDMLFLQTGQPEPIRLHGAYLSGDETQNIVKFITDQFPKEEKVEAPVDEDESDEADDVDLDDPLFLEAAQTVIRHKQGSVSLLQRKLGIGYQRAARLIDKLESAGIVSAYDGSKAREVLVDSSHLEKLQSSRSLSDLNS
ncbi:MAG: DNA translocase FtsK [Candidatus Zixiibacteriota bacterium]